MVENANKTLRASSRRTDRAGDDASVKQTMDDARAAVEGAENMDALSTTPAARLLHMRGYFDLAQIVAGGLRQERPHQR